MKLTKWAVMAGTGLALCLGANNSLAQQDNQPGGGRQRGNFDPAQMRERMMDDLRDRLEVKDDAEWKAIQPIIEKVMEARQQMMSETIRGFFGGGGRGGGGNGGDGGDSNAGDNGGRRVSGG